MVRISGCRTDVRSLVLGRWQSRLLREGYCVQVRADPPARALHRGTPVRGTQWVVFEPNDEPLRAQIRLNVGAFIQQLFRQSAFQGRSPRDANFVKCDGETTQTDRDLGVVNILVGIA